MALIAPFAGWRYSREKFPDLADVIVPPYDVIFDRELARLKTKNPYNFSRIILPEGENKHRLAADLFHRWQSEKIFVRDAGPRLYFYKQTFKLKPQELFCQNVSGGALSRTGIICRVHVEDYGAKVILPHEKTFSGPKADRYLLMEAAQGNMESVFLGYDSPEFSGADFEATVGGSVPDMSFKDTEGVTHEIWPVSDESLHRKVADGLKPMKFYILDGHHRYETALKFYKDHKDQNRPALAFALATICSFRQPGTIILPTHRAVKGLGGLDATTSETRLSALCSVQKGLDLVQVENAMKTSRQPVFALKLPGTDYAVVTYRAERHGRLDLEVLHGEILPALAGGRPLEEEHIGYFKDIRELEDKIENREFEAGFLVRPSSADEVMAVAEKSKVMPHKSTFFYPKIPSGLVVNTFE